MKLIVSKLPFVKYLLDFSSEKHSGSTIQQFVLIQYLLLYITLFIFLSILES
jgi:hypothetical protein